MKAVGKTRINHLGEGRGWIPCAGIWRSHSGQSLIEVSLLIPTLLVLLMGTFDLGRYGYIGILVGNAAHAGAVYGAQGLVFAANTAGIQTAAQNDYQNNGQSTMLTVTSSNSCGCDNGGTVTSAGCTTLANPGAGTCAAGHWVVMVSVTASGTYNTTFPYPGISSTLAISRTSTLRVALN
jgi:Flp pilus assembly protein TadG